MGQTIKTKRGVDIKLKGVSDKVLATAETPETFAIKLTDFHGILPKLVAKVGEEVKAGDTVLYDKYNEKVKFTAPVSGEIVEVVRGAKRRILQVKILADKETRYKEFSFGELNSMDREQVKEALLSAGLWPYITQRPYCVIANPEDTPRDIFISAFDSSPLAPDYDFIVHGLKQEFQLGIDALSKLTDGKVHLTVNGATRPSDVFSEAKGVQINKIKGPHPAGNVGVQIHHIAPINKGEKVWTINPQDVVSIGKFFKNNKFDASRIIALSGSEVEKPRYFKTMIGADIKSILNGNVKEGNNRIICGTVLTGKKTVEEDYVGFYDSQIAVLPEGDKPEFMGWLMPGFDKFSMSRTFFSWMMPGKKYKLTTAKNGEERPFVVTGQYDSVFPMDIYPVQLVKAIMVNDIELMENLGIYEVAPEDFALCEVICTSKINVQEVVREGLDQVQKECG